MTKYNNQKNIAGSIIKQLRTKVYGNERYVQRVRIKRHRNR